MVTRIRPSRADIKTEDELVEQVGQVADLVQQEKELRALKRAALERLRAERAQTAAHYDAAIAKATQGQAEKAAVLERWAQKHPRQFDGEQGMDCIHGAIGYRVLPYRVELLPGWTWPRAKKALAASHGYSRFVREGKLLRQEILLAHDVNGQPFAKALAEFGLTVTGGTRSFYVDAGSRKAVQKEGA